MDNQFYEYIDNLQKVTRPDKNLKGAVVMNCNPFTNGHRYLIENALAEVDFLYVFILEEDKSFFKFEDRIRLVKEGTADLENLLILPSGSYIISELTFPGYFTKESDTEQSIDPSLDIQIFAQFIAPVLNISIRFAGTEPNCKITKQYNEAMHNLLPIYNIKFKEINRLLKGQTPISASHVRKCIELKDFSTLQSIVPESTYKFIRVNYE